MPKGIIIYFFEKLALNQIVDTFKIAYESIKKILIPRQSFCRNPKKETVSFFCDAKIENFQDVNLLTTHKKAQTGKKHS